MVPENILKGTFQIGYGDSIGTAFTIDIDKRRYLITARHVVEGIKESDALTVHHDRQWKPLPVRLVGIGGEDFDIAVLAPATPIGTDHLLLPNDNTLYLSQDVYFLGFPYGIHSEGTPELNLSFPLPLVKKAIVSMFDFRKDGVGHIFLDGHNNPGFSGGPIFYSALGTQEPRIAGVISGYRFQQEPIYHQGQQTPLTYHYNTGIIIACSMNRVMDLIRENPIGLSLNPP